MSFNLVLFSYYRSKLFLLYNQDTPGPKKESRIVKIEEADIAKTAKFIKKIAHMFYAKDPQKFAADMTFRGLKSN